MFMNELKQYNELIDHNILDNFLDKNKVQDNQDMKIHIKESPNVVCKLCALRFTCRKSRNSESMSGHPCILSSILHSR